MGLDTLQVRTKSFIWERPRSVLSLGGALSLSLFFTCGWVDAGSVANTENIVNIHIPGQEVELSVETIADS